jgi:RNA polymerase sigma factor (sigma-70 family)
MPSRKEYLYAEISLDPELIDSFPSERSAYHQTHLEKERKSFDRKFIGKLNWHIKNSLSERQKQVIKLIIEGLTEREIGARLGITQQVVNIYKWRAIKKLRDKIRA